MNLEPDPFENTLRALQRRTLPAQWREEMLQAATAQPQPMRTPRWLLAGWGLAWAATLVMYLTTPAGPDTPPATGMSSTQPLLWQQRAAEIEALLAAN